MKEIMVEIHIKINGEDYLWNSLSEEQQSKIGISLNDRALRMIGYKPIEETIDSNWFKPNEETIDSINSNKDEKREA